MSARKGHTAHSELYKTRTPPWKETYRKRCLERLRGSRDSVMDRFRKLPSMTENNNVFIQDLMKKEWETLKQDKQDGTGDCMLDFDIDEVLTMFDDIQQELQKEEQRILDEYTHYQDSLLQEEQSLCSAIDKLSTDTLTCPICKTYSLLMNKSVIFCKCGLRINTEQDGMSLSNVRTMLEQGVSEHGGTCNSEAVFSVMDVAGNSNLLMTCADCDWMSVVI